MGPSTHPLARFRLCLAALLVMVPRQVWAQAFNPGGAGPVAAVLISILSVALAFGRRFVTSAPGGAMARLAMPAPGGSAQSGALRAAAEGGSHALSAAASLVSRRGAGKTDGRKPACLAARRRS